MATKAKDWREVPVDELSGKVLSAAVAEEVMGWERTTWEEGGKVTFRNPAGAGGPLPRDFTFLAKPEHSPVEHYRSEQVEKVGGLLVLDLPPFHAEIGAAWKLVGKIHHEVAWNFSLAARNDGWNVTLSNPAPPTNAYASIGIRRECGPYSEEAAAEAICRAILKAVRSA